MENTNEQAFVYQVPQQAMERGVYAVLDYFLKDDQLEEVMYNGPESPVKVFHKQYGLVDTNIIWDKPQSDALIQWIVNYNRKTINPSQPIFDGTMYEGSRVNITIPPASPKYSTITIRRFATNLITVVDLIKGKTMDSHIAAFLWTAMDGLDFKPANMLIVGGTGSGKTTFLNALSMYIPQNARIITIEDTQELRMKHSNTLTMVSKKEQGVTMDMLLKNTLRQRPDRILVGEVRGSEAVTLFGAMNTGHSGCIGTLHANTARECIDRVSNPPMSVPPSMLNALDLVVVLAKIQTPKGSLRIVQEITEISASGGQVRFNQLYTYDPVKKKLVSTGIPSQLREKISTGAGISAKQFDFVLKDRAIILDALVSMEQLPEGRVFDLLNKNRYHWKDELAKGWFASKISKVKRMFHKEEVLYL